jgi:hypothetical protein
VTPLGTPDAQLRGACAQALADMSCLSRMALRDHPPCQNKYPEITPQKTCGACCAGAVRARVGGRGVRAGGARERVAALHQRRL